MQTHTCRVHGCGRPTKGFSNLCGPHLRTKQRHGHELQRPVTKGEMTKLKKHVRDLIEGRTNAGEVWGKVADSFEALKADLLSRSLRTGVYFRWERAGEQDLYAACEAAGAEVALTGMSIAYLAASDPHRFVNDKAMFMTAGRKTRLLSPENYGTTRGPSTGKLHRTPKDCNPRRLLHIGTRLLKTFGGAGLALHAEEVAAEKRVAEARTATTRAILGETHV